MQKLIEMFLLTSVGVEVDLLLFLFFTRFLFQLLYSPAHLNQERWNTVGRKLEKKRIYFFSISLAGELLKSVHNFLNKFVSTEQNLVSPILSIKKSGVFVRFFVFVGFCDLVCWVFLLYKGAFGNGS